MSHLTDEQRAGLEAELNGSPHRNGRPPDGVFAIRASSIEPEAVEWLVPQRVPLGGLTLLVGNPGLGKTLYTCNLAAKVTTGDLGPPRSVLMLTAEDSLAAVLQPRLEAAGADLDLVHFLVVRQDGIDGSLSLPDDVLALSEKVRDLNAALVTVDPLMAHLSESVNSYRDQSIRRALAPLHHLAEDTRSAVVVVAHLNKGHSSDAMHRTGGSIGITAAARSGLVMAPEPDDPDGDEGSRRILAQFESNYGERAPSLAFEIESVSTPAGLTVARLQEVGESEHDATRLLTRLDGEEQDALGEAVAFLQEELANGSLPAKVILAEARKVGINDRTLRRAREKLKIKPRKVGLKGGWKWELPEDDQGGWPPSQDQGDGHLRTNGLNKRNMAPLAGVESPEDGQLSDMGTFGENSPPEPSRGLVWDFRGGEG